MLRLFRSKLPGLAINPISTRGRSKIRRKGWYLEKRFKDYTEDDLFNIKLMRKQVLQQVPGMTVRSQRGLFHGKKKRHGHSTCFSEKKTLRFFRPNVQLRNYWSNIFQRNIRLYVTTTTMKKIRYYAGFDNYILLCRPEKMWSSLGEYLRRVMLLKISQPDLNLVGRKIMGFEENLFKTKRSLKKVKNPVFFPGNMRHKDLTHLKARRIENYSRRELKVLKAFLAGEEEFEDYEEEAAEILRKENELFDHQRENTSALSQKLDRWIETKAQTSTKFNRMFRLQNIVMNENAELFEKTLIDTMKK